MRRAALALGLAASLTGCAVFAPKIILPGYLDLPVAPGHQLSPSSSQDKADVSYRAGDGEKHYVVALRAGGWVDVPTGPYFTGRLMKRGTGNDASCIQVFETVIVTADGPGPDQPYIVHFKKTPCQPSIESAVPDHKS